MFNRTPKLSSLVLYYDASSEAKRKEIEKERYTADPKTNKDI